MQRSWFRSCRALALLNTLGVGLSLAGASASVILRILDPTGSSRGWTIGLPTLLLGAIWAWGLRSRRRVGKTRVLAGWLASIPLAATNAGLACALLLGPPLRSLAAGFCAGATIGAVIRIPALLVTLVCFGLPLAWARRAAALGLMGEERGEAVVGVATIAVGLAGACMRVDELTLLLSLGGLGAGAAATWLALARDRRRRRFLSDAEAGRVLGFRVDATPDGRALVRVALGGQGYRVADYDEEVILEERRPLRAGEACGTR